MRGTNCGAKPWRSRPARQPQAPSAEQRRHVAAQFVCGHGVAYQWVNANTVECLREVEQAQVAATGR